jgi:hypothetical protein
LLNPLFIRQREKSALPYPSIGQFTIKASPVPIVFVINEDALSESNDRFYPTNRFSISGFTAAIAAFMGTGTTRVAASVDRKEGVVATFAFTPPMEKGDFDTRPADLLARTLLALNGSFLQGYFHLFSHYARADGPSSATTLSTPQAGVRRSAMGSQQADIGPWEPFIWAGVVLLFIGVAVGVVGCGLYARKASVGGRRRRPTKPHQRRQPVGHEDSGRPFQLHSEDGRIIEDEGSGLSYAGQRSCRSRRDGHHLRSYLQSGGEIKARSIGEVVKEMRQQENAKRLTDEARFSIQSPEKGQCNPLLQMTASSSPIGGTATKSAKKRGGVQFATDTRPTHDGLPLLQGDTQLENRATPPAATISKGFQNALKT